VNVEGFTGGITGDERKAIKVGLSRDKSKRQKERRFKTEGVIVQGGESGDLRGYAVTGGSGTHMYGTISERGGQ